MDKDVQKSRGRCLWIDWGRHLRTHTLVNRLGIDLLEICIGGRRPVRYFRSMMKTIRAIHRRRPATIIATNPSIVLGYFLLVLRLFYRFRYISDAHYAGVHPLWGANHAQKLLDFHNRHVDLVIVTNKGHSDLLDQLGAQTYICPDPLPGLDNYPETRETLPGKPCMLVCSFDVDEPYIEVFRAFEQLEEQGYTVYVSGRYERGGISPADYPWVRFLGFLSEDDFYKYMRSSAVVIDLTTMDDCLVCGAYEALVLEKPLVLSNSAAQKEYFGTASVLTENTAEAIRRSVQEAYERRTELSELSRKWVKENVGYMNGVIDGLKHECVTWGE